MNLVDKQYLELLKDILDNGIESQDRTGVGTLSVFGRFMRFDLSKGFPLLTTKKVHFKSIIHELLWFLSGSSNIKYLQEQQVKIWDDWADEDGNLGSGAYGEMWRNWTSIDPKTSRIVVIDQIKEVVDSIKNNPYSRRHLVSAWHVSFISSMALPPCHYSFQFYVRDDKLSCLFNMRSNDIFLGNPFNIASYALLTHMVASVCGLEVGELCCSLGDCHIYLNHLDQVNEQLSRQPYELPKLILKNNNYKYPEEFKYEDIILENYNPHPAIKAPIAV